jgi:chemotaxis protein methyltransferase CheR
MDLTPFRAMLEKKCGLVFENEKTAILDTGIRTRMAARSIRSPLRYLFLVCAEREEFGRLIDLLTINETYFYRDPVHFALLAERLVPEIFATRGPSGKIRILSAGCSSGEEAYSVLIALVERFGREVLDRITVIGVDIDSMAISAARDGVFGKRSFRDFPEELRKKYFEEYSAGCYRIHQWLRDSVEFESLNLVGEKYPPELRDVDVIFYRNVSIYFSQEVRNEMFRRLAGILNPGGHLFVSPAETFFYNRGILSLATADGVFFYQNGPFEICQDVRKPNRFPRISATRKPGFSGQARPGRLSIHEISVSHDRLPLHSQRAGQYSRASSQAFQAVEEPPQALIEDVRRLAEAGNHEEALRVLGMLIADFPLSLEAHAVKGSILLNLSRLDEAGLSYGTALEIDRFCLDASFSLALIARLQQDDESALRRFREAVYIQPSCWPAHFFLAETHRERGELEHARREYEVILKILNKGDFSRHGLASLPLAFSDKQLETLCHHKLQLVKGERYGA